MTFISVHKPRLGRSVLLLVCFILIPLSLSASGTNYSARSLAMGGAYTALAKGTEAGNFNPATFNSMSTSGLPPCRFPPVQWLLISPGSA